MIYFATHRTLHVCFLSNCCWDSHLSMFDGVFLLLVLWCFLAQEFDGCCSSLTHSHTEARHDVTRCHGWSCLLFGGTVRMEDNSFSEVWIFNQLFNVQTFFFVLIIHFQKRKIGHHTDLKVRWHNAPAVNQVAILVFWSPWHVLSPTESLCPAQKLEAMWFSSTYLLLGRVWFRLLHIHS